MASFLAIAGLLYGGRISGVVGYVLGMLGLGTSLAMPLTKTRPLLILHVILWSAITLLGAVWTLGLFTDVIAGSTASILLGAEVSLWVAAATRDR